MGASNFNDMEMDAIGEIMNISLGASATAVSTMLGAAVNITTPVVKVLDGQEFEFKRLEPAIGVEVAYTEGLEGSNVMMFSRNDVRIIVGMLMGSEIPEEAFEMDEINRSAICEVMNQMMGSSATALAEFLGFPVNISIPVSFEIENESSFKNKYFPTEEYKVVVQFSLEVEGKLKSEFLNIMSLDLAKCLLEPFNTTFEQMQAGQDAQEPAVPNMQADPVPEAATPEGNLSQEAIQQLLSQQEEVPAGAQTDVQVAAQTPAQPEPQAASDPAMYSQMQPGFAMPMSAPMTSDPVMLQLLNQMQQSQMQMMEFMCEMKTKEKACAAEPAVIRPINSVRLEDGMGDGPEERANQEMLMKVPLEISVEIGRTKKRVKEILEYAQGSLVVLDKMAGEQADLYVNGQCIARGDIVVVEDNFGIRITEIVTKNINQEGL